MYDTRNFGGYPDMLFNPRSFSRNCWDSAFRSTSQATTFRCFSSVRTPFGRMFPLWRWWSQRNGTFPRRSWSTWIWDGVLISFWFTAVLMMNVFVAFEPFPVPVTMNFCFLFLLRLIFFTCNARCKRKSISFVYPVLPHGTKVFGPSIAHAFDGTGTLTSHRSIYLSWVCCR